MIDYLLKSVVLGGVFWIVWRLFLGRETFWGFTRWYLLAGVVATGVAGVATVRYAVEVSAARAAIPVTVIEGGGTATVARSVDWGMVAAVGYFVVAGVVGGITLWRALGVLRVVGERGYEQADGCRIVETGDCGAPFSFMRYVFVGRCTGVEREVVIAHEMAHIRGLHRVDLMMAQALCVVQWANPFAWLLLRAVRENHEYLADGAVLGSGIRRGIYKAVLINNALGDRVFDPGHTFSTKNNLKRYAMMSKKSSSGVRKLSALVMVPAAALILAAFAEPRYVEMAEVVPVIDQERMPAMAEEPPLRAVVTEVIGIDGKKGGSPAATVVVGTPKHEVAIMSAVSLRTSIDSLLVALDATVAAAKPLFIVDGFETSPDRLSQIPVESIESITILKDAASLSVYGSKGADGVIVIETVKTKVNVLSASGKPTLDEIALPKEKQPVYIVDGFESSAGDVEKLMSGNDIKSVTKLTGASARPIYGDKGANGAIIIETSKGR